MTLLLLAMERVFGLGIFDATLGGDPLLFQHMFWFYSHPAVYIMSCRRWGWSSEIITCFARKPIFGYRSMAYAIAAIAAFGFMVWGHHMFVAGQSLYASLVFSLPELHRRHSLGDQGVQLDGDALQGIDHVRSPHVVRTRLHRALH